jgi:hypothetical protein
MATLREYFETDFPHSFQVMGTLRIAQSGSEYDVVTRIHRDLISNAEFVAYYVPANPNTLGACEALALNVDQALVIGKGILTFATFPGEHVVTGNGNTTRFCGRVFLYCETELSESDFARLVASASSKGILPIVRGPAYAKSRSELASPVAFISHDSRDKDMVARPIAVGLSKLMSPVWYDDFSLKVGDRLRESIERGIRECRKCILVLSKHFLSNEGWTKVEFNSVFSKELIEKEDAILPVWVDVTREELYEYCPTLVDRLGVKWELGEEEVVRQLHSALRQ